MRKQTFEETNKENKIRYFIIYVKTGQKDPYSFLSSIFTIVEKEEIAKDWCERNPNYYYIERICE